MKYRHFLHKAAVLAVSFVVFLLSVHTPSAALTQIKVAVCADLPPLHYIDETGELTGMHIEFLNILAKSRSLAFEYVIYDRLTDAVAALENQEVRMVLGALPGDVANNSNVTFTNSLSSSSMCMIVPAGQTEKVIYRGDTPSPYRLGFELGSVSLNQISRLPSATMVPVGSQQQLYRQLTSGQSDAVVCARDSMLYMLERAGIRSAYNVAVSQITEVDYMLLMREDDRILHSRLNEYIGDLRASNQYNDLLSKWLIDLDKQDMQARFRLLLWGIAVFAVTAGIIIGSFYYMNARLKVLVDQKTTELNQKVIQLEHAGNLRNRLVEHSPGGSLLVQWDGTILLANSMARTMAGLPNGDAPLGNIRDTKVFGAIWEDALAFVKEKRDAPELVSMGRGSSRHTYRYQCHLTSTAEEIILLAEDVTWEENRKQEIFEQRKNQALNRIIAGVAHEIKNPLMSIRTFSSLIHSQRDDPEVQAAFQEYVPREVDRISKMIEVLINYARPPREHKELISVRELVQDCVGLAYLSAKKKIDMHDHVPEDVHLYANGDQLRQALVNLLINSIEAVEAKIADGETPAGTNLSIRVTGYHSGDEYVLEIYDEGSGMSEDDILQCTDPFVTTKKKGTGMGLALTKQYVRENDGRLEIESTLGEYTRMKMIFKEAGEHEAHRMDH